MYFRIFIQRYHINLKNLFNPPFTCTLSVYVCMRECKFVSCQKKKHYIFKTWVLFNICMSDVYDGDSCSVVNEESKKKRKKKQIFITFSSIYSMEGVFIFNSIQIYFLCVSSLRFYFSKIFHEIIN